MTQNLSNVLTDYFHLFKSEIAKYAERFDDVEGSRIVNLFLSIVEGDLYHKEEDAIETKVVFDTDVPATLEDVLTTLVGLYEADKAITESLKRILK